MKSVLAVKLVLSIWVVFSLYMLVFAHGWGKAEMSDILIVFSTILSCGLWLLRKKIYAYLKRVNEETK